MNGLIEMIRKKKSHAAFLLLNSIENFTDIGVDQYKKNIKATEKNIFFINGLKNAMP